MKITIWSDFVCPFCYIGQANLDNALSKFEHKDDVNIEYKSFLLMPDAEYVPGEAYAETFSKMKGMPVERAQGMLSQVTETAKDAGVEINYDNAKLTSTLAAHRVFQYAKTKGKDVDFFKTFYQAHFKDGEISRIYLNFSDPWPKKRHTKRRLTYHTFLSLYKQVLKTDGEIHFKTDNRGLFAYSLESMSQFDMYFTKINLNLHQEEKENNIETEYERKFSDRGSRIYRMEAKFHNN